MCNQWERPFTSGQSTRKSESTQRERSQASASSSEPGLSMSSTKNTGLKHHHWQEPKALSGKACGRCLKVPLSSSRQIGLLKAFETSRQLSTALPLRRVQGRGCCRSRNPCRTSGSSPSQGCLYVWTTGFIWMLLLLYCL